MTTNLRTEAKVVKLRDGRKVTQITGFKKKRFLGVFPYERKSVCYVARESDVLEVTKSYREYGVFFANEEAWPQHRAIHVANRKFITRVCNCSDVGFTKIINNKAESAEYALAKSLTDQVAHIDAEKPALRVVS